MTETLVESPAVARIRLRWMVNNDMPKVLEIERDCFDCVWTEEDFDRERRHKNNIFQVAEINKEVVGFMAYKLENKAITIISLAVDKDHRRIGVGGMMVKKLLDKLCYDKREDIVTTVRESNLSAQLFFRNMGFIACDIIRDFYFDSDEDGYIMRFSIDKQLHLSRERQKQSVAG